LRYRYGILQVTLAALTNSDVNDFRKEVARRMLLPPWDSYIKSNVNVINVCSLFILSTCNSLVL